MKRTVKVTTENDQKLSLVDLGNKRFKIVYQRTPYVPAQTIYSNLHREQSEKLFLNISDKLLLGTFTLQKPKPSIFRKFLKIEKEWSKNNVE